MQLTSTEFHPAGAIPERFTGEGADVSPPLLWADLPTGTVSLAILCEDPDAPKDRHHDSPFVHWIAFNIAPSLGMLKEGIPHAWKVDSLCEQGLNSMGRPGYNGPFPPVGHGPHRYFFRLFALSRAISLPARPMKEHLLKEIEGAVLGTCDIVGTYERKEEKQVMPKTA